MSDLSWDAFFMSMVYLVSMKSKDERTRIGAVVVGIDNDLRSLGYNGLPRGANDDIQERQNKSDGEKYFWFEHAERNAIYNATLSGVSLKGCRMYTNGIPCMDCARGVVQSGIKEVIVDEAWNRSNSGKWLEHAERSLQLFKECGVDTRYFSGKVISEIYGYRRGEKVSLER